jgi:CBS domain-containing protein/anti-sigma regulatory factor (Ser/Thr protein kinase)
VNSLDTPRERTTLSDEAATVVTRVDALSYELKIGQVMSSGSLSIPPDISMDDLSAWFKEQQITGAPVVEHGKLVGVVSMLDLIRAFRSCDFDAPVHKYMSTEVLTMRANEQVVEALKAFNERRLSRFPVLDDEGNLVGMITKGDVARGLLRELESNLQAEELIRYRASHLFEDIFSERTSLILRYHVAPRDYAQGGKASSYIKRALLRLGADPQTARRCGISVYEAEMNLIIHTNNGGTIRVEIEPHAITMRTADDGPGIADVQLAMRAGYSTAPESAREMGFGAGMGLVNIKRCVDRMHLDSVLGKGTILEMKIFLPNEENFEADVQAKEKIA